jgi:transposase
MAASTPPLAIRRFATPQQLMAFLGLVPSERTTGDTVRRGSITKTGNHRARRVLIGGQRSRKGSP